MAYPTTLVFFIPLLTLYLLAGCTGRSMPSQAVSSASSPRIVGGSAVNVTKVPYIASIEFFGMFACPGAIIAPRWIATSALCMDLLDPEDIMVRTGATDFEVGGNLWAVESLVTHPNYGPEDGYAADLTLVKLSTDIVMNDSTKVISIADQEPAAGATATVSGWGAVADNSIMHRGLLTVDLPIYDRSQCKEHFSFAVSELRICTLKEGAGPCEYDEGDPLVVADKLAGIKSWVLQEQCGQPDKPSLYVNLATAVIRDFIRATAGV